MADQNIHQINNNFSLQEELNHERRSRSHSDKDSKVKENDRDLVQVNSTNSDEECNQIMLHEKKIYKLDPDKDRGHNELVVLSIETKDKIIEVTIREDTNLTFLTEKISVLADFKVFPRKFKEVFLSYLRDKYTETMTNNKIQVLNK